MFRHLIIAVTTLLASSPFVRAMESAGLDTQSCIRQQMNLVNSYFGCYDEAKEKAKPHKAGKKCARQLRKELKKMRRTLCPQNEQPQHVVTPAKDCALEKEREAVRVTTRSRCQATVAKLYSTAVERAGDDFNPGASIPEEGEHVLIVSEDPPLHTLTPSKSPTVLEDVGARAETSNQNPGSGIPAEEEHVLLVSEFPPLHTLSPTKSPTSEDEVGERSNENQGAGIPQSEDHFFLVSEEPPLHYTTPTDEGASGRASPDSESEGSPSLPEGKVVVEETEDGETHVLVVPESALTAYHPTGTSDTEGQAGNPVVTHQEDEYDLVSSNLPLRYTDSSSQDGDRRKSRYLRA